MNSGRERVERRLAAILMADVAGYSRLMGEDEEGTLVALKTIRRELGDPKPTFPEFPMVVGRRIARSGVLGNGKRAPRPQEAVETAGDCAEALELVAFARIKALLCLRRSSRMTSPPFTLARRGAQPGPSATPAVAVCLPVRIGQLT